MSDSPNTVMNIGRLALAMNPTTFQLPYDGRHRRMNFGLQYQDDNSETWQVFDDQRSLSNFQRVDVPFHEQIRLCLLICSNEGNGFQPKAMVFQSRPAMDELMDADHLPESSLLGGGDKLIVAPRLKVPRGVEFTEQEGGAVPALDGNSFTHIWCVEATLEPPSGGAKYEVLVDLVMVLDSEDQAFHFKLDPELIVEGQGK